MENFPEHKSNIATNGFTILNKPFSEIEIDAITKVIDNSCSFNSTFLKTRDLFAIRRFFKEVPLARELI